MAIDDGLNELVRDTLDGRRRITEKRMFGGLAFMSGGNLFLGVHAERLMVRVGVARYQEALALPGVRPMSHGGRSMPGYVFVDCEGTDESALRRFVEWGADVAEALPVKPPKPAAKKPAAKQPAAKKPAAKKPAAKKPVAKQPAAKQRPARR